MISHPSIQFTMVVEQNNQIPFLDVLVQRNQNGTLSHQVYRKPTHTDCYQHATSHHHPSQKNYVISSLVYRAFTISESSSLDGELEHISTVLTKNGYNNKNISQTIQNLKNRMLSSKNADTLDEEREKKKTAVLPYLQGITEPISRILDKHDIKIIFKPHRKISQLLPNLKDHKSFLETSGVYKIPCSCGKVYIGETGRKISTRIKEYQRYTKYGHFAQSALAGWRLDTPYNMTRPPDWLHRRAILQENITKV
ncbi:uncharacterized protein LOC116851269 [Odontomachus brunneus]|uniref:uncharacterized protein LOC116851269 n=1 Tax=Odontomachus brunneus TaxID=486640 RepID=UPI0013F2A4AE|nr:uncharacterized protein LOC116851269 [Odontomachus brunneus]